MLRYFTVGRFELRPGQEYSVHIKMYERLEGLQNLGHWSALRFLNIEGLLSWFTCNDTGTSVYTLSPE